MLQTPKGLYGYAGTIVLLLVAGTGFCQVDKTYDYLPPSPTAGELGKYGLIPIGLATGAMSTSVPIHTLQSFKLSVPISLAYSSTGVRVDQISSNVGMNWSLNAGGVITRHVRDKMDDDFDLTLAYPASLSDVTHNYELAKYLETAASSEGFDSERDVYSYNFQSQAGKFIFSRKQVPVFTPYRKMIVQRKLDGDHTTFILTDESGIQYYFDASEVSRSILGGGECGKNYESPQENSWYITKIIHPEGDSIIFEYESNLHYYNASVSQTITKSINHTGTCPDTSCPDFNDKLCVSLLRVNTLQLARIRTNGYGDLVFHSSTDRDDVEGEFRLDSIEYVLPDSTVLNKWKFDYYFSDNSGFGNAAVIGDDLEYRMFLTSVQQTDSIGTHKMYSFEYEDPDGLPTRLSFSQDHWGYFNGEPNEDLVPAQGMVGLRNNLNQLMFGGIGGNREPNPEFSVKGLLTRITYPTGGYSTITYEANTAWGPKTVYPEKNSFGDTAESHAIGGGGTSYSRYFYSSVGQDVTIDFAVSYLEGAVEDPIHSFGRITVRDSLSGSALIDFYKVDPGDYLHQVVTFEPGRVYQVIIYAYGDEVLSSVNYSLYDEDPEIIDANNVTGGMRVSKIVSTSPQQEQDDITRYYYTSFSDTTMSSGVISDFQPLYYQFSESHNPCSLSCSFFICNYATLSSNSNLNLNSFGGNNIVYKTVVVVKGVEFENGYEEHEFLTSQDAAGLIVYGENIVNAPFTNFGWDNSLEKSIRKYRNTGSGFEMVHQVENEYVKDERIDHYVPNMVVRKKYELSCPLDVLTICTEERIGRILMKWTCVTDHNHVWLIGGIPIFGNGETTCIAFGCDNEWTIFGYDECYYKTVGDSIIETATLQNIDALEYKDLAHWSYLKSSTEKSVSDSGDTLIVVKNFRYGDTTHLQLTSEFTSTSDGKVLTTKYWYPVDFDPGPFPDSLLVKNILARTVKTEMYVNDKTVKGQVTKYNGDGSVAEIWKRNESIPPDSTVHDPGELIPSGYEKEGKITRDFSASRPREVHYPDGKVATLIWGYGRRYLIAQVMGKSAADVATALGADFEELESSSDNTFINTTVNTLRSSFPGIPIVSYTFTPGLGITSQVDQNGLTTFYEYDPFMRLRLILDNDGNILKKYEYNFKNGNE